MHTVGYLVDRTFDLLLGAEREDINVLVGGISATETTFPVKFNPPPKVKSYMTVDTEIMFVVAATPASGASSTVQVIRGMKGTTAAAHTAGALIYVNPFWTRYQVRQTIQDEIRSWGPQVYAIKTLDLSGTQFVRGYDLGDIAPFFDILDVRESPTPLVVGATTNKDWKSIAATRLQNAPKATFPSGQALIINTPGAVYSTPRTYHVVYSAPFDVDTAFTDDVTLETAVGMDASDIDIPPYGAAWRLAASRELRRLLTQAMGQVADLQAYPPGYAVGAAEKFKELRDSRLADAKARIYGMVPLKRTP